LAGRHLQPVVARKLVDAEQVAGVEHLLARLRWQLAGIGFFGRMMICATGSSVVVPRAELDEG